MVLLVSLLVRVSEGLLLALMRAAELLSVDVALWLAESLVVALCVLLTVALSVMLAVALCVSLALNVLLQVPVPLLEPRGTGLRLVLAQASAWLKISVCMIAEAFPLRLPAVPIRGTCQYVNVTEGEAPRKADIVA